MAKARGCSASSSVVSPRDNLKLKSTQITKGPLEHVCSAQVWSVVALPDSSGFVSCSADHDVKFWEWQVAEARAAGSARQLGARHTRTLKMADDVLCCRVSTDGRLLAVALLDSTIQVCGVQAEGKRPVFTLVCSS